MTELEQWLSVARQAAARAAELIAGYLDNQQPLGVEHKADGSPVTKLDVAAEEVIVSTITEHYPQHAIYGEETGRHERADSADVLWLVDPIDGTKSLVRGYPFFSTQIAVMRATELVVGVSAATHYQQTAWATLGGPAQLNDAVLKVSAVDSIEQATISTGNIASLANSAQWTQLGAILARANRTRGYGDFLHYHLLAAGKIDAVIESDVNILDIAALKVIVEAAGGRFTALDGAPVDLQTRSVLAAPPGLHKKLLGILNGNA